MLGLDEVKQAALEVGFDACGVARADALTDEEYPLREWLRRGWHGNLGYMERNIDMRMDPRLLVPGAKSVICCVSAYPPPNDDFPTSGGNHGNRSDNISQDFDGPDKSWKSKENPQDFQNLANREKIAAYARTREYHAATPSPSATSTGPPVPAWAGLVVTPYSSRHVGALGLTSAR